MISEGEVVEGLSKLIKGKVIGAFTGEVISVDTTKALAKVLHDELTYDVKLKSIVDSKTQHLLLIPKIRSKIFCIPEGNSQERFLAVAYNEIERVELSIGSTSVLIDDSGITFNEGENGGLTITPDLVNNLDKLTARVDGIINAIRNAAVVAGDGGAGFKTNMAISLSLLTDKEDFSGIESSNILH